MAAQPFTPLDLEIFSLVTVLILLTATIYLTTTYLRPYLLFAYTCFLKPLSPSSNKQQDALEAFYASQASIYDATRAKLLRGREEMLTLAAAQLRVRTPGRGLVWVDVGGGTGWNVEKLDTIMRVRQTFERVYLVDLSPSLCKVAERRVKERGWDGIVEVVCCDARQFKLPVGQKADWVSMSYSLSMIPDYYSVVDSLTELLDERGVITVVDFYAQSETNIAARNYTGGALGRHVNWFSRQFWRIWFEFDRVNLDEGRRDYLEYRYGTVLSVNERNVLFGGIPYYIWIGCKKLSTAGADALAKLDAAATESPYLGPVDYLQRKAMEDTTIQQLRSKALEAAIQNLSANLPLPSFFYQNNFWRIYYDESLRKHRQFNDSFIYAFTWEDARVDHRILKINSADSILAITSAGDNILHYLLSGSPRRIHAVDLNPTQNHLLELKVAAFAALPYSDVWKLFGNGHHLNFRDLLISKLSPHLSSRALSFWLDKTPAFSSSAGLYGEGQSGIPIKTAKWLFRIFGVSGDVKRMCAATTLNEQREIWNDRIRPVMLSWWVSRFIIGNEKFLWKALGVPVNQRNMILQDYYDRVRSEEMKKDSADRGGIAIWEFVINTLDPVVQNSLIGEENYFYFLCLMGEYSERCRPSYLTPRAHSVLSLPKAFDCLRIHTDELNEVLSRLRPSSLTIAVIMDSMDWFSPTRPRPAKEQIRRMNKALKVGGRVLLRSAGVAPWYVRVFEENGFQAKRVAERTPGSCIDRVNMYASTWVCTKKEEVRERRESVGKLEI